MDNGATDTIGEYSPNLGEKKFRGVTEEGSLRGVTAQVVDVSQNLLSVYRCVKAGNRVVMSRTRRAGR